MHHADGTGWSNLADRYGLALLFPEQQTTNNPQRCFNWFEPEDSNRNQGEALSIRQMVEHMIRAHGINRSRVFVTGLSAGGAMTSVMLAIYPEVFTGGRSSPAFLTDARSVCPKPSDACSRGMFALLRTGAIWCERPRRTEDHGRRCQSGTETTI
jgi:poly(hydroxyalkanoate) depolymerase family esterase